MTFTEIQEEIRQGKNLDMYLQSNDKFVRREVARAKHRLDVLVNDPAEEVRVAVVQQGYGIAKLLNDRSDWVRLHAMQKAEEIQAHNAGYDIIQRIELGDNQFVVGHNPKAPSPFVTWKYDPENFYYSQGHYFVEQQDATLDLFRRAGETLNLGDNSLARSLLTQDDKDALWREFREDNEKEAVIYALMELIDDDYPYDLDSLKDDPEFMARAIHLYQNIDHSYENEALADNLKNLLEDFPQHKQNPVKLKDFLTDPQPIRISPEEAALLNDLLKIPSAKIPEIYGPFGDNFDFTFTLADGYIASLEMIPYYDPHLNKLSQTEPPYVQILIANTKNHIEHEEIFLARDLNYTLTGTHELKDEHGEKIVSLTIQEDEKLRRVGNRFRYNANTQEDSYGEHDGETCTVKRTLTPKENDILINGLMWEAEFPNGDKLHVFDYELMPVQVPERKPALSDLLSQAENKKAQQSEPTLPAIEKDPHAR